MSVVSNLPMAAEVGLLVTVGFAAGLRLGTWMFNLRLGYVVGARDGEEPPPQPRPVPPPWGRILWTALWIGGGAMAVAFWIGVVQQKEQDLGKATDLFFKGAAPFIAFAYFIYQILGGTFFATTAVVLSAERSKDNPRALVVKLSIERGSQWVAEIVSDELFFHRKPDVWDEKPMSRKVGLMPRRRDGLLRMAAGEKSSTEIRLKVPAGSFFITARIVSRAIYWPTPSESFARVCVPAIAEQQAS